MLKEPTYTTSKEVMTVELRPYRKEKKIKRLSKLGRITGRKLRGYRRYGESRSERGKK